MSFEELMQDGAEALADVMREPTEVEIIPATGSRYTVKAIVLRGDLATRQADGGKLLRYEVRVIILKSLYPVVKVNADKIGLRLRTSDQTNTERTVTQILSQDGAQWQLGL